MKFRLGRRWFGQLITTSLLATALGSQATRILAQNGRNTMTQAKQKKGIESLQLVNVAVSVMDLERAIAWYTDKLGFTLKYPTPAIEGIELALMEKNGLYVDLIHHPEPVNLEPDGKDPPFHLQIAGLRNLVFFVDDIAAAVVWILTYVVMPQLTRLFYKWLYPTP